MGFDDGKLHLPGLTGGTDRIIPSETKVPFHVHDFFPAVVSSKTYKHGEKGVTTASSIWRKTEQPTPRNHFWIHPAGEKPIFLEIVIGTDDQISPYGKGNAIESQMAKGNTLSAALVFQRVVGNMRMFKKPRV